MTKSIKRVSLGIVFFAVIAAMMMLVAVADYSGTDTNVSWNIDVSEGVLTVSGSGAMPTYANGSAPWYQHKSCVKAIVVNSGVTVSKGAFYGMENLERISVAVVGDGVSNNYFGYIFGASNYFQNETYVPASLNTVVVTGSTVVPDYAFNNVSGVEKIVLSDTVATVGSCAFKDCASLKYLVFGSGIKTVGKDAILRCDSVVQIFYNGTSTGWGAVTLNSNVINPVYLGSATLSVTAPAKKEYRLGEKLDLTGLKVTFGSNDVTDSAEVIAPDMTTIGVKNVEVVFGVKTVTFPVTVASAGTSGVSGSLTWSIENGVLTIGGNGMMDNFTLEILAPWYAYRNAITSVKVSNGVTSVGSFAFYGLDKVTSITLSATVETVEYAAFENCSVLTDLTISNGAAVVDGTAFRNCNGLFTTTNGVTYAKASDNASYALISVDPAATSFTIPETTVVIGEGAFENSAVTSINVPDGVLSIGDNAFASSRLTSVTLGLGVKNIGSYAFVDCSSLTSLTLKAIPDLIGAGALAATGIVGTTSNGAVYLGVGDNDYAILWKAADTELTSCTVNDSTKVIASLAFAGCSSLEAVQLPSGLLHIGDSAFNSCTELYSIQLPASLITVGDSAFKNCSSLTSATLSDSVKTIGNSAFRGASKLAEIVINANVENVGFNAFRDCTGLTTLVYNAGGIGYKTFNNCTSLKNVYLADTVVSIGDQAFAGCSALTDIAVPDTTAYIGNGALLGCNAITDIALPFAGECVNGINDSFAYAFGGAAPAALNTVLIGSDIKADAFDGITVETLIIDKTTSAIEAGAFETLPAAVYYLGSDSEWAAVTKGTSLANVVCMDSSFELISTKEKYEMGEVLDRANFTAKLGLFDATKLLRFVYNPISLDSSMLPAKLGSVSELFVANDINEVEFTNYSLLLEGSIGVKFYVKLSDYAISDLSQVEAKIDYLGVTYDAELVKADNTIDSTIYTVKFYVAAKEMDQPITLTIKTPNENESITRTVKDYVEYVNDNAADYTECIELINEMYNYGEYSRQYFLNAEITPNPDLTDVEVTISNSYKPVKKGDVEGIALKASSLLLESNTTVRHYFELADGKSINDYTFTVNGAKVTPSAKDGLYFIEVNNIIARSLGKLDKTVISTADETMVITYSPLSYVKLALENRAEEDPELAVLVKALYRYYVAASEYFAGITDEVELSEDESKPSIW